MWYEIIPSAFLSGGLMILPGIIMPPLYNYRYGYPQVKFLDSWFARNMFLRDLRVKDGNFHKRSCLESIPDS